MKSKLPSPPLVISVIALVVALGGTATAASVLITDSSQVRSNSIRASDIRNELTGRDVRNGTLSSADIKNGSVSGRDLRGGTVGADALAADVREAIGDARRNAPVATEVVRRSGPENQAPGQHRVITLPQLQPGTYLVTAKSTISPVENSAGLLGELLKPAKTASAQCVLELAGDQDNARQQIATPGSFAPATVMAQMTRTIAAPADATYTCDVNDVNWRASDSSIIALRLQDSTRTDVTG